MEAVKKFMKLAPMEARNRILMNLDGVKSRNATFLTGKSSLGKW